MVDRSISVDCYDAPHPAADAATLSRGERVMRWRFAPLDVGLEL